MFNSTLNLFWVLNMYYLKRWTYRSIIIFGCIWVLKTFEDIPYTSTTGMLVIPSSLTRLFHAWHSLLDCWIIISCLSLVSSNFFPIYGIRYDITGRTSVILFLYFILWCWTLQRKQEKQNMYFVFISKLKHNSSHLFDNSFCVHPPFYLNFFDIF